MERERIDTFEQMKVWQEAHALVLRVFEATPGIPPELQEGVAVEMEKIAVEVPKCIAQGFRRRGSRNKAHYYNMSQSALEALRYYFILARDLKCDVNVGDLTYRADQVGRMLDGLVRSVTRNEVDQRGGRRRGGRGGRGGRDRGPIGEAPLNEEGGEGALEPDIGSGADAEDDYHEEGGSEE